MLSVLAAPQCSSQGVIDPCLTDLQEPGHRQPLQTHEGEKELILSPALKQAVTAYKALILWISIQKMKTKQLQPTLKSLVTICPQYLKMSSYISCRYILTWHLIIIFRSF